MKDEKDLSQVKDEKSSVIHKPAAKLTIDEAYDLLKKQENIKCLMKYLFNH